MGGGSRRAALRAAARARLRAGDDRPLGGPAGERVESGFVVRAVPGGAGTGERAYLCPGCDQELPARQPHVVAWPEGAPEDRRHWHTPCWAARSRRLPRLQRGRDAPRYG